MPEKRKLRQTQWAAQFAVASELCKMGYEVAFTSGNHPQIDLMVRSPNGESFDVDVKGLYKKNYFLLNPTQEVRNKLFYVLAYVPEGGKNEFFVLSQADAYREVRQDIEVARERQIAKGGTGDKAGAMPGIGWEAAQRYKDLWKETLPA
jgi:hypothetical protein